ncbi:hypothetical protein [Variovorax sp. JS1663]|uniref:hypothetical protein n=1 Tax=Variovorax sp. JS1663 TaxID=1851577 RepID=UPI00117FE49E|nr:hypothetical protein [Variovorax sp. JS1663]
MNQNKHPPWLDQAVDGGLFQASASDIASALSLRELYDYDYGIRFKGEAIHAQGWSVGFVKESATEDDSAFARFFQELSALGEADMLAIPAKAVRFELTGTHDVLDFFEPPLIANAKFDFASYVEIRSSMIQMIHGSFFVFPKSGRALLLNSSGKYAMFAGPRRLVEKIIDVDIEASWEAVRANDQLDPLLLPRLRPAIIAYGMSP